MKPSASSLLVTGLLQATGLGLVLAAAPGLPLQVLGSVAALAFPLVLLALPVHEGDRARAQAPAEPPLRDVRTRVAAHARGEGLEGTPAPLPARTRPSGAERAR